MALGTYYSLIIPVAEVLKAYEDIQRKETGKEIHGNLIGIRVVPHTRSVVINEGSPSTSPLCSDCNLLATNHIHLPYKIEQASFVPLFQSILRFIECRQQKAVLPFVSRASNGTDQEDLSRCISLLRQAFPILFWDQMSTLRLLDDKTLHTFSACLNRTCRWDNNYVTHDSVHIDDGLLRSLYSTGPFGTNIKETFSLVMLLLRQADFGVYYQSRLRIKATKKRMQEIFRLNPRQLEYLEEEQGVRKLVRVCFPLRRVRSDGFNF